MDSPALTNLSPPRPATSATSAPAAAAADEPALNFGDLLTQGMAAPEAPASGTVETTAQPAETLTEAGDETGESDLSALGLPATLLALQQTAAQPQAQAQAQAAVMPLMPQPFIPTPIQETVVAAQKPGALSGLPQSAELSGVPAKSAVGAEIAVEKPITETIAEKFSLAESATNLRAAGPDHSAPAQLTAGGALLPVAQAQAPNHAPAAAQRIDVPLAQTGWADAFSQRVVWLVGQQQQSAELHVNPPDLGPIDITLSLDRDRAQITFVSAHAPVRDAIENALPRLQEALQQAGIQLGGTSVSAESSRQQQGSANLPAPGSQQAAAAHAAAVQTPPSSAIVITRQGLVDIFA